MPPRPLSPGAVTDLTHSLRTIFGIDAVLYGVLIFWAWRSIHLANEETESYAIPTKEAVGAPGDG